MNLFWVKFHFRFTRKYVNIDYSWIFHQKLFFSNLNANKFFFCLLLFIQLINFAPNPTFYSVPLNYFWWKNFFFVLFDEKRLDVNFITRWVCVWDEKICEIIYQLPLKFCMLYLKALMWFSAVIYSWDDAFLIYV